MDTWFVAERAERFCERITRSRHAGDSIECELVFRPYDVHTARGEIDDFRRERPWFRIFRCAEIEEEWRERSTRILFVELEFEPALHATLPRTLDDERMVRRGSEY